jgi:transposase-like protein
LYPVFIRIGFERLEVAKHPIFKGTNRMNSHKHARLTYARRLEMVRQMTEQGFSAGQAALAHGVTAPTARKWLGRYLVDGEAGLAMPRRVRCARPGPSIRARRC